MLPAGYNNAYRIVQTNDTLIIIYEMIHDVRIIPLGKHRHIDEKIKLWMGDSVAHWEGETLIVETTNYNDRGMIANSGAGGRLKGVPVSESLHVVERFTRISENTIIWEARITDPVNFTQPFTISTPLTRDDEYVMYEYACHEGNTAIANVFAAVEAGVDVIDASAGGIGGCPFAPRATGNVATEDVVYMLERGGFSTGIDLDKMIETAHWLEQVALKHPIESALSKAGPFPPR